MENTSLHKSKACASSMRRDPVEGHNNSFPHLNRRTILKGAGIVGASALAATAAPSLTGCADAQSEEKILILSPEEENIVSITESFSEVDQNPPHMAETANYSLPTGTVLTPAEGTWIGALIQGQAANPLVKAGVLSLASGNLFALVEKPVTNGNSIVIQDVRSSNQVFAWLEVDASTNDWALYGASFAEGRITSAPTKIFSADAQWEAPSFCAAGDAVLFQVCPTVDGTQAKEDSAAYLWREGMVEPKNIFSSNGRFAAPIVVSQEQVILTPRIKDDQSMHYAITTLSLADNCATTTLALGLPAPIKPAAATIVGGRLAFTVDAAYTSSGPLGKLGTYLQEEAGNTNATQNFYFLSRDPYVAPTGTTDILVAKNRASYLVAALHEKTFGSLYATNRAVDYGEYPLRTGTASDFATYTAVKDPTTGRPVSVNVRIFAYQ